MKVISLLITLVFLFSLGTGVLSQETELPKPGLTPDSPFYFLDILGEKIGLFFTFGAEKKAEKAMQYAGEKLAEVKAMAEANKVEALKKASQKYQEYLSLFFKKGEEAYEAGKDITKLTERSKQRSLDYLIILSDIHERISGEKAKAEIDNLRNVSREFFGETIWSMHEKKMEELQKVEIPLPPPLPE